MTRPDSYSTVAARLASARRQLPAGALELAFHAALPVALDAGFLHLLRINFFQAPPLVLAYEVEAELLLSSLFRELADDLYEIDPEVRNILLRGLTTRFGIERLRRVANLLDEHTRRNRAWQGRPELAYAQHLSALSARDPQGAAARLARAEATAGDGTLLGPEWYVAMRDRLDEWTTADRTLDAEVNRALRSVEDGSGDPAASLSLLTELTRLPGGDSEATLATLGRAAGGRATEQVRQLAAAVLAQVAPGNTVADPHAAAAHDAAGAEAAAAGTAPPPERGDDNAATTPAGLALAEPGSRAVLIGVGHYRELPDLPAVETDLRGLRRVLTDPEIGALDPARCSMVVDPDRARVMRYVSAAAREAEDTLFVYYAGHWFVERDQLLLTASDTLANASRRAVTWDEIAGVLGSSGARHIVVVLDCDTGSGDVRDSFVTPPRSGGSDWFLLAAGISTNVSLTRELIRLFGDGTEHAPAWLTLDAVTDLLRRRFAALGAAGPVSRASGLAGQLMIVRNRARDWTPPGPTLGPAVSLEPPLGRLDHPVRGREDLLETLIRALGNPAARSRVQVVAGPAGTGKTMIALALAAYAKRAGLAVWWLRATVLVPGMRALAAELGVVADEDPTSTAERLRAALDTLPQRWLLVIDADDMDVPGPSGEAHIGWLRSLVDRPPGMVIMTSRHQASWPPWCELHRVGRLPYGDAGRMLRDVAGERAGPLAAATLLAERLGGLPVALRLAGDYLAATPGSTSEALGRALESPGFEPGQVAVVGSLWTVLLAALADDGPPGARALLELMCQLADTVIPIRLLAPSVLRLDQALASVAEAGPSVVVDQLGDAGFIERVEPDLLRVRPAVREIVLRSRSRSDDARHLRLVAALLYHTVAAAGPPDEPAGWADLERLEPHSAALMSAVASTRGSQPTIEHARRVGAAMVRYLGAREPDSRAHRRARDLVALLGGAPTGTSAAGRMLIVVGSDTDHDTVVAQLRLATCQTRPVRHDVAGHPVLDLGMLAGSRILLVRAGDDAPTAAPSAALDRYRPDYVVMIGSCVGLRPDEQRRGDVLVADVVRRRSGDDTFQMVTGLSATLLGRCRAAASDWDGGTVHFGQLAAAGPTRATREMANALGVDPGNDIYPILERYRVAWIAIEEVADWTLTAGDGPQLFPGAHNAAAFVDHVVSGGLRYT